MELCSTSPPLSLLPPRHATPLRQHAPHVSRPRARAGGITPVLRPLPLARCAPAAHQADRGDQKASRPPTRGVWILYKTEAPSRVVSETGVRLARQFISEQENGDVQ
jgi:hypothetical protein